MYVQLRRDGDARGLLHWESCLPLCGAKVLRFLGVSSVLRQRFTAELTSCFNSQLTDHREQMLAETEAASGSVASGALTPQVACEI
mmetsp:Transcript_91660/g.210107  ORF Transcript_91660/g.210107 Transcript_91660/m.210107 type:complete len:86 (+) Transcript_91660:2237-2494(+)